MRQLGVLTLLLAVGLWFPEHATRGLWEPDEARYAYVAREMRWSGSWLMPMRHGVMYPDKPPLMFWLINAASVATGGSINGISARFPSLLGAWLSLWMAAGLAQRWGGRSAALKTPLVLATMFLFWQEGGMGQIDALLCGLEMVSFYLLVRADEANTPNRLRIGAYLCMGLAIMAKGPVGLVVPMGAYATALAVSGDRAGLRRWHWAWGPVVALIPGLCWVAAVWTQDGAGVYLENIVLGQTAMRMLKGTGHNRPVYYFLLHVPVEMLPWTLALPIAFRFGAGADARRRRFLIGWAVFVVCFFSLPTDKRHLYVLFAYPAVAILLGLTWADWDKAPVRWRTATRWAFCVTLALLGVAGVSGPFLPGLPFSGWLILPVGVAMLCGAVVVLRGACESRGRWLYAVVGSLLVTQVYIGTVVYHALDPMKTPWELADAAKVQLAPDQRLLIYRTFGEIHALYAERQGELIRTPECLSEAIQAQGRGIVVLDAHRWPEVRSLPNVDMIPHPFSMGHRKMVWVEFDAHCGRRQA